jgi:hypothetical protein
VLVVLLLVVVAAARVGAQEPGEPGQPAVIEESEIPALPRFLEFIASPPGALITGIVVSIYLARWPWYQRQTDELKKILAYGITVVVAATAYVLVTYVPDAFWTNAAPYWVIIVFCFFAIFGNQGWFQIAIKRARTSVSVGVAGPEVDGERSWKMIGDEPSSSTDRVSLS